MCSLGRIYLPEKFPCYWGGGYDHNLLTTTFKYLPCLSCLQRSSTSFCSCFVYQQCLTVFALETVTGLGRDRILVLFSTAQSI